MPVNLSDHLFARLLSVDSRSINSTWNASHVRSSYWRLYINNRAGASITLEDSSRHELLPGRVHLVPAWVLFSCHNQPALQHFFIHFDVVDLPGPIVRNIFPYPAWIEVDPVVRRIQQSITSELPVGGVSLSPLVLLRCRSLVEWCLARLINTLEPEHRERLDSIVRHDSPIAPALAYIDAHLGEDLSNPILAHHCYLSVDHFIKRFRQMIQQTPARYVLERRVSQAAQQLLFTSESIECIARAVGFSNRFHFTRIFARRMGMPPAAYRQTVRV